MNTQHDFLNAWKHAIAVSQTPGLFCCSARNIDTATNKDQLRPKVKDIRRKLAEYPKSRGAFLATLVSFYNPEEGASIARKLGVEGVGGLAINLNDEQRHAIAELFITHKGW